MKLNQPALALGTVLTEETQGEPGGFIRIVTTVLIDPQLQLTMCVTTRFSTAARIDRSRCYTIVCHHCIESHSDRNDLGSTCPARLLLIVYSALYRDTDGGGGGSEEGQGGSEPKHVRAGHGRDAGSSGGGVVVLPICLGSCQC